MHVARAAQFTRSEAGFMTRIRVRLRRVTEKLFISSTGPAHPKLDPHVSRTKITFMDSSMRGLKKIACLSTRPLNSPTNKHVDNILDVLNLQVREHA